jgi:voltage-gated potassium channel
MESRRFRLQLYLVLMIVVVALGTIGFMTVEGLSFVDALYFNLVTIATVGYGDIHPVSQLGKILSILLIIAGVGTFLGVVANATEMMLQRRENRSRMKKLNMIIGVFFSQVGTRLLSIFATLDPEIEKIRNELIIQGKWSEKDLRQIIKRLDVHSYKVDIEFSDLERLKDLLAQESPFMLRLLENPNLMEHESFTDLLWAVFHLAEELMSREDIKSLPKTDMAHISGDIQRAYQRIVRQWLDHMKHLRDYYPYLFSLSVRTNPFNLNASPIVE